MTQAVKRFCTALPTLQEVQRQGGEATVPAVAKALHRGVSAIREHVRYLYPRGYLAGRERAGWGTPASWALTDEGVAALAALPKPGQRRPVAPALPAPPEPPDAGTDRHPVRAHPPPRRHLGAGTQGRAPFHLRFRRKDATHVIATATIQPLGVAQPGQSPGFGTQLPQVRILPPRPTTERETKMHDLKTIDKINGEAFLQAAEKLRSEGRHVLVTYDGLHVTGFESFSDQQEAFAKLNQVRDALARSPSEHFKMLLPAYGDEPARDVAISPAQDTAGQPQLTTDEESELDDAVIARDKAQELLQEAAMGFAKAQAKCYVLAADLQKKMADRQAELPLN